MVGVALALRCQLHAGCLLQEGLHVPVSAGMVAETRDKLIQKSWDLPYNGIFPRRQSGSGPEVEDRKSEAIVPPAAGCKLPPVQPTKLGVFPRFCCSFPETPRATRTSVT